MQKGGDFGLRVLGRFPGERLQFLPSVVGGLLEFFLESGKTVIYDKTHLRQL